MLHYSIIYCFLIAWVVAYRKLVNKVIKQKTVASEM